VRRKNEPCSHVFSHWTAPVGETGRCDIKFEIGIVAHIKKYSLTVCLAGFVRLRETTDGLPNAQRASIARWQDAVSIVFVVMKRSISDRA
jgi:hypothetical protein